MVKKIKIELKRSNVGFTLKIKTPKEIEDFYKNKSSEEIRESTIWQNDGSPSRFYKISDDLLSKESSLVFSNDYNSTNNYGSRLIDSSKINIGVLRTVGISNGVSISSVKFSDYTTSEMELYVRQLGIMVKKLYEELIKKINVKAVITFEI